MSDNDASGTDRAEIRFYDTDGCEFGRVRLDDGEEERPHFFADDIAVEYQSVDTDS